MSLHRHAACIRQSVRYSQTEILWSSDVGSMVTVVMVMVVMVFQPGITRFRAHARKRY